MITKFLIWCVAIFMWLLAIEFCAHAILSIIHAFHWWAFETKATTLVVTAIFQQLISCALAYAAWCMTIRKPTWRNPNEARLP
jgi:hypothetical protein